MVLNWIRNQRDESAPSAPEGVRLYAVGDVHGRLDLLDALLARIADDASGHAADAAHLIVLGDMVDRGPETAGVLDRLIEAPGMATTSLLGNHEQALLDFLNGEDGSDIWLEWGGLETLMSYGVDGVAAKSPDALRAEFAQVFPAAHRAYLEALPLYVEHGDYVFVHAGVKPGAPLEEQRKRDLIWIRSEFHNAKDPLGGRVVVHGHHPVRRPVSEKRRIGVDTGAVNSGRLTAVVLEGATRRFLAVEGDAGHDD